MLVLLDTNTLGLLTHHNTKLNKAITGWLILLRRAKVEVKVPEICDYELRRELIRINSFKSIAKLDNLNTAFGYVSLNTETVRLASKMWAQLRNDGLATADDKALDGDVILAAQALIESNRPENKGKRVVIATDNIKHLKRLADAEKWENIKP
jgi:hypothetical protein